MTQRRTIIICCLFFFVLVLICGVKSAEAGEKSWSGWYNTDSPIANRPGDDESVDKIRQRGLDVCSGNHPVDVLCRDVNNQSITFNEKTRYRASNYLFLPCTTKGIICRNEDQDNDTCRDYEVRFECKAAGSSPMKSESLVIIIVAACLSVLLPIICVTVMHIIRRHRIRGRQEQLGAQSTEQSAQTEAVDLPPSYSVLFGEGVLGPQAVTLSRSSGLSLTLTTADGDIEIPLPVPDRPRRGSSRISSLSVIAADTNQSAHNLLHAQTPGRRRSTTSWRRRFPNLHLSIFDILAPSETETPSTSASAKSTFSYMCTPPPTYQDAVIMLTGGTDICLQIPSGNGAQEHIRIVPAQTVLQELVDVCEISTAESGDNSNRVSIDNDETENEGGNESEPDESNTKL